MARPSSASWQPQRRKSHDGLTGHAQPFVHGSGSVSGYGVVHLVGKATGAAPEVTAVRALLARYPDFGDKLPSLAPALAQPDPGFSYTQWEAYLAIYHQRPVFIHRPADFESATCQCPREARFVHDPAQEQAQQAHYRRLCELGRDRGQFATPERLSSAVLRDLVEILPLLEACLDVPPTRLRHVAEHLVGRDAELTLLNTAWNDPRTNVVVIRGKGGEGKTSLVAIWMAELAAKDWRGAERVILRALVTGERDPHRLAEHRDHRCHASTAEIAAALTGNYRPGHLFVLQQNLELFDTCQAHLATCDRAIQAHIVTLTARMAIPPTPLPPPRVVRKARTRDNEPRFDMRTPLHHRTGGVDLSQIDGLSPYTALKLLPEIGTDMSRWPTEKHFTSWLTLAPKNRISGGRLLSSRTQPSANRAATILRMAAMSLGRTQAMLGAFYRRLAARVGKAHAITATARKLAILVYRALKGDFVYRDVGADGYQTQQRARILNGLRRRAATLGFEFLNRRAVQPVTWRVT